MRSTALILTMLLVGCGSDPTPGTNAGTGEGDADGQATAGEPDINETPDEGVEPDAGDDPDEGPDVGPDIAAIEDTGPEVTPPTHPCDGAADGSACDDGNDCTIGDACLAGECVPEGEPYLCSDGLGCTKDVCDGQGGCSFPVRGDRCLIAGVCYFDGDQAQGPCLSCVPPLSQNSWSPDDTLPCDDGDFCTDGDHCFGGTCVLVGAKNCADSNYCTDDGCDNAKGCTHVPNDRFCDDGDPCTLADKCTFSVCLAGDLIVTCDDGNNCTLDLCVAELGGCAHEPAAFGCDDGNPCTINDQCDNGACASGPPLSCIDDNSCTDDKCHPENGCVFPFNEADCSDGDPCSLGDICAFGECQSGPLITLCSDNSPCTNDFCNPSTGECEYTPNNAASCNDGNKCTVGDYCENGACQPGGISVVCDDENPCTDDLCGADGLCQFLNNLLQCDDGDPCTKGDACVEGLCQTGADVLVCNDLNPCTDDFCAGGDGCQFIPNEAPCNDGNPCTVGDLCVQTQCTAGKTGAACNDQNPCTDDQCLQGKGCVNFPNTAGCSDDDPCTVGDQCFMGECVGEVSDCDDGNICTKEICLAGGACDHVPINSPECKPEIHFINPPRGAMLKGPQPVFVTGWVKIPPGGLKDFFINDNPVEVNPMSGAFTVMMEPKVGINIITAITNTNLGGEDNAIRSFSWSTEYFPAGGQVPNGIGLWLSQAVWDDNNTSDVDDIATVITMVLDEFDLPSLIPNPLTKTSVLGCDYTVSPTNVSIGNPQVDITTKNQALELMVTYPNLFLGLDVSAGGFFCPDISGSVSASFVRVTVDLVMNDNLAGLEITMANSKVDIHGLDIDIDGILGFLVNWIINFFEGTVADQIEGLVLDQLSIIPETLADALNALAFSTEFEIPSFIGDAPPSVLSLTSALTAADFDQFGGFLEMSTVISAGAKKVPYTTLGSLGRDGCFKDDYFFDYLMQSEIEIALKDDMMNQMLHAIWYAGALEIPLGPSVLGDVDVSEYGVVIKDLSLSFLLPPIMSDCNFDGVSTMTLGDVKFTVDLDLFGNPLKVVAYMSAEIAAEMVVNEDLDGSTAGILLEDILIFGIEVEEVSQGFEGAQAAVEELIGGFIGPDLFTGLGAETLGGFPLPAIPLDGFSESIPSGTVLELSLTKIYRLGGRTVMAGNAK